MAATERSFSEFPPLHLYFDTDFILNYLIPTQPHHSRVVPFLQAVQSAGITTAYVSSLNWLEFGHVVRRESFRNDLPSEWQQTYRLSHWRDPQVQRTFLDALCRMFEEFLDAFGWSEVSVTPTVRRSALALMPQYNLDSHDAVHVASCIEAGVLDIASFDAAFRRVDGLFVWNDLIHRT